MLESKDMGKWFIEKAEQVLSVVWFCLRIVFVVACCYFMFTTWQFYHGMEKGRTAELVKVIEGERAARGQEQAGMKAFIDDVMAANCSGELADEVFEKYGVAINCDKGEE